MHKASSKRAHVRLRLTTYDPRNPRKPPKRSIRGLHISRYPPHHERVRQKYERNAKKQKRRDYQSTSSAPPQFGGWGWVEVERNTAATGSRANIKSLFKETSTLLDCVFFVDGLFIWRFRRIRERKRKIFHVFLMENYKNVRWKVVGDVAINLRIFSGEKNKFQFGFIVRTYYILILVR